MIYIFEGCRECIALPGKACLACGSCCQAISCNLLKQCCLPLRRTCECSGKACLSFVAKPFSSYVMFAITVSCVELYFCVVAIDDPWVEQCDFEEYLGSWIGVRVWLSVQAGFALLNLLFAPWFQYLTWEQLLRDARTLPPRQRSQRSASRGAATPASGQTRRSRTTARTQRLARAQVRRSVRKVFLEDFTVLFYVIALGLSWGWSYLGRTVVKKNKSCDSASVANAYATGLFFLFFPVVYCVIWSCCPCCVARVQVPEQKAEPPFGLQPSSSSDSLSSALDSVGEDSD